MRKLKLLFLFLMPLAAFGQQTYTLAFDTVNIKKNLKLPNYSAGLIQVDASGHIISVAINTINLSQFNNDGIFIPTTFDGSKYTNVQNINDHAAILVQNTSSGTNANASIRAKNDVGDYIQMGINGSGFTALGSIQSIPGSASLVTSVQKLYVGSKDSVQKGEVDIVGGPMLPANVTIRVDSLQETFIHHTAAGNAGTDSLVSMNGGKIGRIAGNYYYPSSNPSGYLTSSSAPKNGLQSVSGGVGVGGSLLLPTTVTVTSGTKLNIVDGVGNGVQVNLLSGSVATTELYGQNSGGTQYGKVQLSNPAVTVGSYVISSGNGKAIVMDASDPTNPIVFTDAITEKGAVYAHNYGANFTAQSLVDKNYVDSARTAYSVSLGGSYTNPSWITSLAYSKLTGAPTNVSTFTNDANYLTPSSTNAVTNKDLTGSGNTFPTFNQSTTGNAATATVLATARAINGVNFDGSAPITITANTPNSLTPGYALSGTAFNGGTGYTWNVDTSKVSTVYSVADSLKAHAATIGFGLIYTSGTNTLTADTAGIMASKTYVQNYTYTKNQILSTSHAFTASQNITVNSSANTTSVGLELLTTTAATSGNQQYSPYLHLQGNGWGTTAGSSQAAEWRIYVAPVQAGTPNPGLNFDSQVNGGGWSNRVTLSGGQFTASGYIANFGAISTGITSDAYYANNSTAATSGTPNQYSPNMHWRAEVWNTTATAANNWVDFKTQVLTTSGTTPVGKWTLSGSLTTTSTASYTDLLTVDNLGNLTLLNGLLIPKTYTVATLPAASSYTGAIAEVSDASSPTYGSTVAGSGTTRTIVMSNGTNWIAH